MPGKGAKRLTQRMARPSKYPEEIRKKAIELYRGGLGYKAVARELGVSRDAVRAWISSYRRRASSELPLESDQKENEYRTARLEYERSAAPLKDVAAKYGHNYNNLRNHIKNKHPESEVMHNYNKYLSDLQGLVARHAEDLQRFSEALGAHLTGSPTSHPALEEH